jgi:hypothetical protein
MSQSYATHRRLDPWYHYVALPLWLALFVLAVIHLFKGRAGEAIPHFLLVIFLGILVLKVRSYALRVQDRVIRTEETLRMKALLAPELQAELHRLKPAQFVALRFASDGELAVRVEEALREELGGEAIKKRIQTWRPDEFRV